MEAEVDRTLARWQMVQVRRGLDDWQSHICLQKTQEEQLGSKQTMKPKV